MARGDEALRAFLERYPDGADDLLSLLPFGLLVVELRPELRVLYSNSRLAELIGQPPESVLAGAGWVSALLVPEDLREIARRLRRLRDEGERFSAEFRVRCGGRGVRWFHCEAVARRGGPGRIAAILAFADVTDRKSVEIALEVERRERQSLLEALPVVVYEMEIAADDWTIAYVSPQIEALSGYPAASLLADPKAVSRMIHPDDLPILAEAMRQSREGRRGGEAVYRIVRRDGSIGWVRNRWAVVPPSGARAPRLRGVLTDVTAERCAQAQAEETLRLYRTLIEHIPGFVFVLRLSPEGVRVIYLSPQAGAFFQRDPEAMLAGSLADWSELIHPEDLPRLLEEARRAYQTREPARFLLRVRLPDGAIRWTRAQASVISRPGDPHVDLLGVGHDVTAEREAEERARRERELEGALLRADRLAAVGQLAAGIAHEVNNALASLLPYGTLIALDPSLPESAREHGRRVEEQAQRIAAIVRGLLNLARQSLPRKAPWPLDELVRDTLTLVAAESRRADIDVSAEVPPGLVVLGDRGQLQQVLLNLFSNAIQAMAGRPERRLSVSARETADHVEIRVRDTGPGVAPEIRERLFTSFVTTRPHGSGLGLAISASIVKAHGGEIRLEGGGEGASFVVRLPRAETPCRALPPKAPGPPGSPAEPLRALVVDDEPGVRVGFAKLLERFGATVEAVADGPAALRRLEESSYDVVFLDLRMPGMSGMEVYERLQHRCPELARRVVLMTADAASLEVRVFLDSRKVPVLLKPFDLATVRRALSQVRGSVGDDASPPGD